MVRGSLNIQRIVARTSTTHLRRVPSRQYSSGTFDTNARAFISVPVSRCRGNRGGGGGEIVAIETRMRRGKKNGGKKSDYSPGEGEGCGEAKGEKKKKKTSWS